MRATDQNLNDVHALLFYAATFGASILSIVIFVLISGGAHVAFP